MSPPALTRWARAADFLALLLVIIALTVSASGGFRVHIGQLRVALTTPYRLLVLAVAIQVLRHLVAPERPVYRHLPEQIAAWARSAPLRAATTVTTGTRPAIFFAGYLTVLMFGFPANALDARGKPPLHDYDSELLNLQLRWDAGWYLQIARDGYAYLHEERTDLQQNIVFFPAYPILTRIVALLLGNREVSYIAGGTFVSLVAFLLALAHLYRLAREHLDEDRAAASLWLLAAYPFSLFYGAIYSESLYLLGTVAAFYHFRRREFVRAGAWGLLVGLTRPIGFSLCLPLALMAIEPWLPPLVVGGSPARDRPAPRAKREAAAVLAPALATAAMPVVGMLLYSAFIWSLTGDPLKMFGGHTAWGRHYQGFTHLVTDRYDFIWHAGLSGYVAQVPQDLLNGLGVLFVLATVWPVARRLGLAYAVFILINILPPLAAGGLLSAGRFSSVLFPAFIWLAAAVPVRHRAGWIVSFAAIQAFNAALFYTWRLLY